MSRWFEIREFVHDTLANRPVDHYAERYFFATDTKELFYDDGAAWHPANGVAFGTPLPVSAGEEGRLFLLTTDPANPVLYMSDGTDWVAIAGGGGTPSPPPDIAAFSTTGVVLAGVELTTGNTAGDTPLTYTSGNLANEMIITHNGRVMRVGATLDVVEGTPGSTIAFTFDLQAADVIQMIPRAAGVTGGTSGTTKVLMQLCGGRYNAALGTSVWVGHETEALYAQATHQDTYGSGATPVLEEYNVDAVVPFNGTLTKVRVEYRVGSASTEGTIVVVRGQYTNGSGVITSTIVATHTVAAALDPNARYQFSTALSQAVEEGDSLGVYYRSAGTPTSTIYLVGTAVVEEA